MGGGGDGHSSTSYKGYTIPHPKRWHAVTGKGLCAVMWFWVLYRAKQDGPVILGWRHPWEGHEDHSHGHGHEHEVFSAFRPSHKPFLTWAGSVGVVVVVVALISLVLCWYVKKQKSKKKDRF